MELPLWLALELAKGHKPIVRVELPKIFKETYREILKADASSVDLHKFSLNFYELGAYVKKFDRGNDVHDILLHVKLVKLLKFQLFFFSKCFRNRFRNLLDLTENSLPDPLVLNKLDRLELRLFREGQTAKKKLTTWMNESGVPLEAGNMVVNHKKRKRIEMEDI